MRAMPMIYFPKSMNLGSVRGDVGREHSLVGPADGIAVVHLNHDCFVLRYGLSPRSLYDTTISPGIFPFSVKF